MHSDYALDFADAQLLQTAITYSGTGNDADQPDYVRFLRSVARLLRTCVEQLGSVGSEPSTFLLHPYPPPATVKESAQRHRMLDNGRTPVQGKLWMVGPLAASGYAVRLEYSEDDDVFKQVADEYRMGSTPAVIYDPRTTPDLLRFYRSGLDKPDERLLISLPTGLVTVEEVTEVIERVYQTELKTPDAQSETGKLWENADKFYAKTRAEQTVQMYLKTGLSVAFPHCEIRPEQPGITGRSDLEIEESDKFGSGSTIRHVLIELKVLREFGVKGGRYSQKDNDDWIDSGVDQAWSYADERGTRAAMLCCFDMRKLDVGDACFAHVREKAESHGVVLKVWYIYASAKAYRTVASAGTLRATPKAAKAAKTAAKAAKASGRNISST